MWPLSKKAFARLRPGKGCRGRRCWASRRSCARWRPGLKHKALAKEIPKAQRHAVRPSLKQAFGRLKPEQRGARDRLIATLHQKHGYTQAQIAAHLGLHYATVSRIVSRQTDARNKT